MDQTHRLILEELEDRVEQIFAATEELREVVGDGKTTRQLLDSIFRNVHSLKASASSNDLDNLTQIAHQFENLLHSLRVGRITLTDEVLRAFDATADALFANLTEEAPDTQSNNALFQLLHRLSEGSDRSSSLEVEVVLNAIPGEIWQALSEEEKHRLEQAVGEGASLFLIATNFDIADFDRHFQNLKETLAKTGELISTAPKVDKDRPDKIDFRILYTRESDLEQVKVELAQHDDVTVLEICPGQTSQPTTSLEDQPREKRRSTTSAAHWIRIDLDDLDRLISSTHRLFRDTTACFEQAIVNLPQESPSLKTGVDKISTSFMDLAAELVNLRMVSIDRVLQRAFRAGRSAATTAGKDIEFTIHGQDLKIDKSLSDSMSDPLIHLVRNAVDHGIESEEQRIAANKDKRGRICIEVTTIQGQTRIRVTDDGHGIDPELVARAATRLGVLPEAARIDIDKCIRLLFRPGFSTATSVSEISGRGVGLDAVETAIEELGGAIRVSSEPGLGSVFEIRLPVTFSLLDVVVVREGKHRYLIDASQVVSVQRSTRRVIGTDEVMINNEAVQLLQLDELLGLERGESGTGALLHCCFERPNSDKSTKTRSIVLSVSELPETEQVLVRNLGSRGGRWVGVAGAAEMADGSVALLLDLAALTSVAAKSS